MGQKRKGERGRVLKKEGLFAVPKKKKKKKKKKGQAMRFVEVENKKWMFSLVFLAFFFFTVLDGLGRNISTLLVYIMFYA